MKLNIHTILLSMLALALLVMPAHAALNDREYLKTKNLAKSSRQLSVTLNVSGSGIVAVPMGTSGTITGVSAVLMGAMAGTSSTLTPTVNGSTITLSGTLTLPSSSTPATGVVSNTALSANTFKPGDVVGISAGTGLTSTTAAGAGTRTHAIVTFTISPSY